MHIETDFDLRRAILVDRDDPVLPLLNPCFEPLVHTLMSRRIAVNTPVLVMDSAPAVRVFSELHLVSCHVVQSEQADMPWLVSYCVICNAGACFSPIVAGKIHHFTTGGIYNAMTILMDEETGSYWHHITGQCMYGPLQGAQLERMPCALLHMSAQQALNRFPQAQFALSTLTVEATADAVIDTKEFEPRAAYGLSPQYIATFLQEDFRLPRLEMGLGVWTNDTSRFYPFVQLNAANNALIDWFNDHAVVIYIDPETSVPAALYTTAHDLCWRGQRLQLSTGEFVTGGVLHDSNGEPIRAVYPLQLFQRWFSYALTFPNGEIYNP